MSMLGGNRGRLYRYKEIPDSLIHIDIVEKDHVLLSEYMLPKLMHSGTLGIFQGAVSNHTGL